MYSVKSYQLTKQEYNYLLPVLREKLLYRSDNHYFIGNTDDLTNMLNRLKGLYDYYNELESMTVYKCSKEGNITPYRNELKIESPLQIN